MGLSSKILPHNFNEILDAAIDYIEGREFNLYPDFPHRRTHRCVAL